MHSYFVWRSLRGIVRAACDEESCDKKQNHNDEEKRAPDAKLRERDVYVARDPAALRRDEDEQYTLYHLPYSAWPPWCVSMLGRTGPHRREIGRREHGFTLVAMCFAMSATSSPQR